MTNVIDFFSRRPITTVQDMDVNDLSSEEGVYIGNIGKDNALAFRSIIAVIENMAVKMQALMDEFNEMEDIHIENTVRTISMLDAEDKFDPEIHELSVSEGGHVWVVDIKPE